MKSGSARWERSPFPSSSPARCAAPTLSTNRSSPTFLPEPPPQDHLPRELMTSRSPLGVHCVRLIKDKLRRPYAPDPRQDLAGRSGGRRGLDALEFSCRQICHHRCALRGGAECRILSEDAALCLIRSAVDRALVYSGDRGRASLRLGASELETWSRQRIEDRLSGWLPRRLPGKLRAGNLVRRRSRSTFWLDDRNVDWRHPGCAGRGVALQGLASLRGFDEHCGPVSQHFGDALHDFGRVIAGADYGVAAQFGRVLQHQIAGFGARLLAQC